MSILIFFFFSSRRRHTRYWRDWSSDVCSSDLGPPDLVDGSGDHTNSATLVNKGLEVIEAHLLFDVPMSAIEVVVHPQSIRSEERRVGKECRSRWSPYH